MRIFSIDAETEAVDEEKGTEIWKVETRGAVAGSAAVVDGVVYIVSEDGVLARDVETANGGGAFGKRILIRRPSYRLT